MMMVYGVDDKKKQYKATRISDTVALAFNNFNSFAIKFSHLCDNIMGRVFTYVLIKTIDVIVYFLFCVQFKFSSSKYI